MVKEHTINYDNEEPISESVEAMQMVMNDPVTGKRLITNVLNKGKLSKHDLDMHMNCMDVGQTEFMS